VGVARKLGGVVKKSPTVPEYPVEKLATMEIQLLETLQQTYK
jgi:hypothetical protein